MGHPGAEAIADLLATTAVLQLAVVVVSGSVALLADMIHNFSDALTAIPLWVAFALGSRAATRRHAFGYGLAELPGDVEIVAYRRGPYRALAPTGVAMLRRAGRRARRLEDGFPKWRLAGLPVAVGSLPA